MESLKISLKDNKHSYNPREEITGEVEWTLEKDVATITLRLMWFTAGKGTVDAEEIEATQFANPSTHERRPFRFRLPNSPYSFSGKLISLNWALEAEAGDSDLDVVREEFTMAPGGKEVALGESERSIK